MEGSSCVAIGALCSIAGQYSNLIDLLVFAASIDLQVKGSKWVPYADGNPDFWNGCPKIQHPRALVEIVCWDATCTLLLSKDDDLTYRFRTFFTDARDLDDYNALLK